jgi:membrane protease YdiL (CAAX protease family)
VAAAFIYYSANTPLYRAPASGSGINLAPAPTTDLVQVLILSGTALLPLVVAMFVRRQPIRSTGWHQTILVPAALMGLSMAFFTLILRNRFWVLLGGVSGPEFYALLTALGICLAEETIFRGYILMRLAWWLGEWPGLALSSLLYTGWHLPAWLGHQPIETVLMLSLLTFLQGMVLGWIMRKSRHILAPAIYRAVSIWMQVLV